MRTALKNNEKLLLITRHHWLKLLPASAAWLVINTLVIIFAPVSISLIVLIVSAVYPMFLFFTWHRNIWAVTNFRVIDESGFFTRYAKESPLDKINNIEYDQSFWGRLLGFGDVDIQTAAEMGSTNYKMIHNPRLLKDTITRAQEDYKKMQVDNQAQQLAKAISSHQSNIGSTQPQLVADELKKLFELMQAGAITSVEYIRQKNRLIGTS